MSARPPSTSLPRLASVAMLFLTVSACTLQVLSAVEQLGKPDAPSPVFAAFIPALLSLLLGVGLSALLDALARVIEREPQSPPHDTSAPAVKQLTQALIEARTILQASAAARLPPPTPPPTPAPVAVPSLNGDRHLQRMVQLLEELNQRTRRNEKQLAQRRTQQTDDAGQSLPKQTAAAPLPSPPVEPAATEAAQEIPKPTEIDVQPPKVAESPTAAAVPEPADVKDVVEVSKATEIPAVSEREPEESQPEISEADLIEADDELKPAPPEAAPGTPAALEAALPEPVAPEPVVPEPVVPEPVVPEPVVPEPVDIEAAELDRLHQQVQELLATSDYDAAQSVANDFLHRFPHNPAGPLLVERIVQEAEVYVEQTTARLFDEIRSHVERRHWRRSLEIAQHLLEKFPQHPRAGKIRPQLRAIQHNAHIEERQAQEAQLQELLKARRFSDAIDVCEDLLHRFPQSPQAQSLSNLLPRLRERAAQESAGSGVFAG